MMRDRTRPSEVITAKWKTSLAAGEEIYGTIALDDKFDLVFPMLESQGQIPDGTSLLWGLSDHLKRCSILTLPFRFGSVCYTPNFKPYFLAACSTRCTTSPRPFSHGLLFTL